MVNLTSLSSKKKVPVLLQAEAAECGLLCINMIAQYYGDNRDITHLRQQVSVSLRGATLMDVMNIAAKLNFQCRALKVELSELKQLPCPAILHWDMQHFVVLTKVTKHAITVNDPALGKRTLPLAEAGQHVTGIALEVLPNDTFKPSCAPAALSLRDFFSNAVGVKRNLFTLLTLSALIQLFSLAAPYYMQTVVDDVLIQNNHALLKALALGFCLLLVIEIATNIVRRLLILTVSTRLQLQLSASVFNHLLSLPLDYFAKRHVGDVVSRFGSLSSIREFLTTGLVAALLDGVMTLVTLAVMFVYSVELTLTVLMIMAIYLAIRLGLVPLMRRLTSERIGLAANEQSHFMESVRGMLPIRVYQQETKRQSQWQNKLVSTLNKDLSLGKVSIGNDAVNQLLFGIENLLVIYIAASLVMDNTLTVGMMLAFIAYKGRFSSALDNVINSVIELRMLDVHFSRIGDILLTPIEQKNTLSKPTPGANVSTKADRCQQAHLVAHGLTYRYGENCDPVISDIELTVTRGEFIAIVGASGNGKSTLLKCLMGLYQPSAGKVAHYSLNPHSQGIQKPPVVASVLQEDVCLSGSITDNISCFDEVVDHERLVRVAQMACIHHEILAMPMQYHTLVGDMGSSLSGGQKQRLLLARALYQQPDILFLDEASSHLDLDNERHINHHLKALNITRIMVAHRPQSIAQADTVYRLSDGRLTPYIYPSNPATPLNSVNGESSCQK